MTTALESDLNGQCADLVRALEVARKHASAQWARIGRLTATIERMDAEHLATVKELVADIIRLTADVERLEAENAALLLREAELPY